MAVIKRRISKIYAKAKDRNYTHLYKDGRRFDSAISCDRKMVHFSSGNPSIRNTCSKKINIYALQDIQVPQKTYESLRLYTIKKITKSFPAITKDSYSLRFEKYPHQLLRFHAIASGARADRISQGMARAFGKIFMRAAKVKAKDLFMEICLAERYENETMFNNFLFNLKKLKSKFPFQVYMTLEDSDKKVL